MEFEEVPPPSSTSKRRTATLSVPVDSSRQSRNLPSSSSCAISTSLASSSGLRVEVRVLRVRPSSQLDEDNHPDPENVLDALPVDKPTQDLQNKAFQTLMEKGIEPVWCGVSECLSITKKTRDVFVLPVFHGEVFEHLLLLKCRIYGPQLCIEVESLPKLNHPVYCQAMRKACVCFSGFSAPDRKSLSDKVRWMQGIFLKDLVGEKTTHLVVTEVSTEKYKAAASQKPPLPILTGEWVSEAWEVGRREALDATDLSFWSKFQCPVFRGLTISFSGYDRQERDILSKLVTQNGGEVTGRLKKEEATHLVTDKASGDKFKTAEQWGSAIQIVRRKWIERSVEAGYCLDVKDFLTKDSPRKDLKIPPIKPKKLVSTPERSFDMSRVPDPNCSGIVPSESQAGHNATLLSNVSNFGAPSQQILRVGPLSKRPCTEAPSTKGGGGGLLSRRVASASSVADSMLVSFDRAEPKGSFLNYSKSQRLGGPLRTADMDHNTMKTVDMTISTSGDFLEGCTVCVVGFGTLDAGKLRKIINAGGGTRVTDPAGSNVTHVVIGAERGAEKALGGGLGEGVWAVTVEWLVESFQNGTRLSEEKYWHPLVERKAPFDNPVSPLKQNQKEPLNPISEDLEERQKTGEIPVLDHVLSQYLPPKDQDDNPPPADEDELQQPMDAAPVENVERGEEEAEDMETDDVPRFLEGLSFAVRKFGEDKRVEELLGIIEDSGGLLKSDTVDYLVVPLMKFHSTAHKEYDVHFQEEVTNLWLQMCYEESEILPLDSNILFRPLVVDDGWETQKFLDGSVVCLTGFTGAERDALSDIALKLGARCQDHMSKRRTKDLLATTHLVARTPSGGKWEAANKWKIPAVKASWLVHSLLNGAREAEETHGMDAPTPPRPMRTRPSSGREDVSVEIRRTEEAGTPMESEPMETAVEENVSSGGLRRSSRRSSASKHPVTPALDNRVKELMEEGRKRSSNVSGGMSGGSPFTPSAWLDKDASFHPRFNLDSAKRIVGDSPAIGENMEDSLEVFARNQLAAAVENTAVPENFFSAGSEGSAFRAPKAPVGKLDFNHPLNIEEEDEVFAEKAGTPKRTSLPDQSVHNTESSGRVTRSSSRKSSTQTEVNRRHTLNTHRGTHSNTPSPTRENKPKGENPEKASGLLRNMLDKVITKKFEKKTSTESLPSEPVSEEKRGRGTPLLTGKGAERDEGDVEKGSLEDTHPGIGGLIEWRETLPQTPKTISPHKSKEKKGRSMDMASEASQGVPRITETVSGDEGGRKSGTPEVINLVEPLDTLQPHPEPTQPPERERRDIAFQSTSLKTEEKKYCAGVIEKLGGTYVESQNYDPNCSHLILGQPARNEKLMACIASGKFVLHKSYLEASEAAGYFIHESEFEWGSPSLKLPQVNPAQMSNHSWKLAMGCQRWRLQLQEVRPVWIDLKHHLSKFSSKKESGTGGAYAGWRVLLFVEPHKIPGISRLLVQGGATVLPLETKDLSRVTYALVEEKSKKWSEKELKRMFDGGVKCVKMEFISSWLIESPIDEEEYFVETYRKMKKGK